MNFKITKTCLKLLINIFSKLLMSIIKIYTKLKKDWKIISKNYQNKQWYGYHKLCKILSKMKKILIDCFKIYKNNFKFYIKTISYI